MRDAEIIKLAEDYLISRGIGFFDNPKLGRRENGRIEVNFSVLKGLDTSSSNAGRADVSVWVGLFDNEVEIIQKRLKPL